MFTNNFYRLHLSILISSDRQSIAYCKSKITILCIQTIPQPPPPTPQISMGKYTFDQICAYKFVYHFPWVHLLLPHRVPPTLKGWMTKSPRWSTMKSVTYLCYASYLITRVPSFFSENIPGYLEFCPGKKSHSPGYIANNFCTKTCNFFFQYNIEMMYILTFQVLSRFSAKFFLFCSGFLTFGDKFQAISRPGQIIFKSPGFPGF